MANQDLLLCQGLLLTLQLAAVLQCLLASGDCLLLYRRHLRTAGVPNRIGRESCLEQ